MCSIFKLNKGQMIPYDKFFNAMHNNEHGYGILLKDANNKMEVRKGLPEKVDPEGVYRILEDNIDVIRWVHLRNQSKGDISKDNVQPIPVYHSSKVQAYFMHNGTIYNTNFNQNLKDHVAKYDEVKDSDSVVFARQKLEPFLARFKGANGFVDVTDPFFGAYIDGMWQSQYGRGVIITNHGEYLTSYNSWHKIKDTDGNDLLTSNDDYYDLLKRGTLFDQRKKEEDEKRAKEYKPIVPVGQPSGGKFQQRLQSTPFMYELNVSQQLKEAFFDIDIYSPEGQIAMSYLDHSELVDIFKEQPEDSATLFSVLTAYLVDAYEGLSKITKKHDIATQKVAELTEELKKHEPTRIAIG